MHELTHRQQFISSDSATADPARLQRELVRTQTALELSNRARGEFFSRITHELHTPLNVIIGFAQLLETASNLTAEQRDNVREIKRAGDKLLALVENIIHDSKRNSSAPVVQPHPVGVGPLVAECLELIAPLADRFSVTLHNLNPETELELPTDRRRLKQALLNLLHNAVKYNRPEGLVAVKTRLAGGLLRITVEDTGPGIPAELQASLFKPFKLLEQGREPAGTGIGLMVTRHLVEMLGGTIVMKSRPGEGCLVQVALPAEGLETKAPGETGRY